MNPVELEQIDVEEIIHNFSYTNLETNKISFDLLKLYFNFNFIKFIITRQVK